MLILSSFWSVRFVAGEELDYSVLDPELQVILLDSTPSESYLAVRDDSAGRLFVGGREALFVYEPDERGRYRPRQELFRFPDHSWIYDIEVRGHDLFVTTVNALYLLPKGVSQRQGLTVKRLIWGIPRGHVHQCLHGLAWGPDGDLYFSTGDPIPIYGDYQRPDHWAYWTYFFQPAGTRIPYHGLGGVFRCRPDGSHLQVVCGGTRNSCGLAFDSHWNLFTNDNDHEGLPSEYVPGRLLHVTSHAHFSWPRGWMPEKQPDRADLLETVFPGMGRAVPVGEAFYDDAFLPAKYRNSLLVARWGIRAVTYYPLEPRGASFKAHEEKLLVGRNDARPVGVCVGRGGRIFVTIAYMAHNEGSPTYPSDLAMITRADDPSASPFEPYEAAIADPGRLWSELSNPSWSRRTLAFVELRRRGGALLEEASRRLESLPAQDPALESLLWLAAAQEDPNAGKRLLKYARHENSHLRFQAVRALAEFPNLGARADLFTQALSDASAQIRHAATVSFFKLDAPVPEDVLMGSARSQDTYLRQAAARLIAERGTLEQIDALCASNDRTARLAGVLSAGFRLTMPGTHRPLADELPLEPYPGEEVYVLEFADTREKVDLRSLGRVGTYTVAEHWKAHQHTGEEERLFNLLQTMLADSEESIRLQAAFFLNLLNDPRSEPLVAKVRKDTEESRLLAAPLKEIPRVWLMGPFPDQGQSFRRIHPPEQGPIDLEAQYPAGAKMLTWDLVTKGTHYDFAKRFGNTDGSSTYAYWRMESAKRQRILLCLGSDDGLKVWHNGRPVWTVEIQRGALPLEDSVFLELVPGSNDLLVRVQNIAGASGLYLHYRAVGSVAVVLPEKLGLASLADRLKNAGGGDQDAISPEFLKVDWAEEVAKGSAERGRQLFQALSCSKCHADTSEGPGVGAPSLADASKRFTLPYLVESVLLPSKVVSPLFRASVLVTKQGRVITGLVVNETSENLEVLQPDATPATVKKSSIKERQFAEISLMPQGLVKSPEELRDLLAYLLSDKP
ncbi:MAG: c-type cytochrome [Planctomycetes bacterium]|nr:c-type cytochrome [Planctomycetota bacterium]